MGLVSRLPAEDCAGLLCAPAAPGRTTPACRIMPAINTAMAGARMSFHSQKMKVFINTPNTPVINTINTLVPTEQQAGGLLRFQASRSLKYLGPKTPQSIGLSYTLLNY